MGNSQGGGKAAVISTDLFQEIDQLQMNEAAPEAEEQENAAEVYSGANGCQDNFNSTVQVREGADRSDQFKGKESCNSSLAVERAATMGGVAEEINDLDGVH